MPILDDAEVHLWRIPLRAEPGDVADLWSLLSVEEKAEAEKLPSAEQRAQFATGRAAVRQILAMYLERPPEEVHLRRSEHGKLCLVDAAGHEGVRFNVSHSRDLAVLAVAHGREIGVDIEALRPVLQLERIVDRVLSPAEKAVFLAAGSDERVDLFFRFWTQKKAYVKAIGCQSRIPLDRVEVDFRRDTPVELRASLDLQIARNRFTVCDFIPETEFRGAFAVGGRQLPKVRCWKWFGQM